MTVLKHSHSKQPKSSIYITEWDVEPLDDVLREDQLLRLSDRDWELVSSTLESPPEPNEALKNLLKTTK
jgi:uncharacterized protein (DUF1778 family)